LALGYELQEPQKYSYAGVDYTERYEIGSVESFLKNNPDGFDVYRDPKHMRNQGRSLMARLEGWLDGEQIEIWISVPSNTAGEPMLLITYFTDECGRRNFPRSHRVSNFQI
jgi:hypothetical protein